jgi:hypothetical protein
VSCPDQSSYAAGRNASLLAGNRYLPVPSQGMRRTAGATAAAGRARAGNNAGQADVNAKFW